jgi:hypothetical protein
MIALGGKQVGIAFGGLIAEINGKKIVYLICVLVIKVVKESNGFANVGNIVNFCLIELDE